MKLILKLANNEITQPSEEGGGIVIINTENNNVTSRKVNQKLKYLTTIKQDIKNKIWPFIQNITCIPVMDFSKNNIPIGIGSVTQKIVRAGTIFEHPSLKFSTTKQNILMTY